MLKTTFLQVFNMSITASIVILRVLVLRYLFRKQPKIYSYVLWGLVLFRLLCPYSISLNTSLFNLFPVNYSTGGQIQYIVSKTESDYIFNFDADKIPQTVDPGEVISENNIITSPEITDNYIAENCGTENAIVAATAEKTVDFISVVSCIWVTGILYLFSRNILSMWQLKKALANSKSFYGNVRICGNITTAFITGILKPVIYLPENLSEDEINFILVHEETHISRGDYLFKLLGFVAVCLHWFNPLVWLFYKLAEQDMEMSCDEAVIRKLGQGQKRKYSQTLLSISAPHNTAQLHLAFGEGDTKSRILNVLDYKQPAFRYVVGICVVIAVSAVMLVFNPTALNPVKITDIEDKDISKAVIVNDTRYIDVPSSIIYTATDTLKSVSVSPLEDTFIHENGKYFFFIETNNKEIAVNFSDDFTQMWITGDNIENTGAVYTVNNPDKISGFFKSNFDERNTMTENTQLVFPALSSDFPAQSYLVNMILSEGWYVSSQTYDSRSISLATDSNSYTVNILNNARETVGAVTFGTYDSGILTADDIYKDISNRTGYPFFDEEDRISDHIYSESTETLYHNISDDHEMAEYFRPLIVSCNEEYEVFAAISFFPDMITESQVDAIATSVEISPVENMQRQAEIQLGSFWLKPDEDDSVIADTAAIIHLRDNLKLKNYEITDIAITSPLYSSVAEFEYPADIFTNYMYVVQVKYNLEGNGFTSLIYIKQVDDCNYEITGSVEDSMIMEPVHIASTYQQTKERIVRTVPKSQAVKDDTLNLGEAKVISEGEYGLALEKVVFTYSNGIVTDEKVLETTILRESKPQITAIGTLWNGTPATGGTGQLIWPTAAGRISRGFTGQYPYNHNGIDISAPAGTYIYAAADGVVTKALYTNVGYGIYCEINHGEFKTLYAQCSSLDVVVGQKVQQGQLIGAVGSTGNSTGPHLHFEVIQGNERLDPYRYF